MKLSKVIILCICDLLEFSSIYLKIFLVEIFQILEMDRNGFGGQVLWLRLEAKSERALGPGATVGVPGVGIPRLACLRPTTWLRQWPRTAHLHQQTLKTLARGQALQGGRCKTSSGAASLGRLARGGEIKARDTSRGFPDLELSAPHEQA